jgi:hypothetical protein
MFKRLFPWIAAAGLVSQAALALDPPAFVADPKNACQPNQTRAACFLRYTVQKIPGPPGGPRYRFVNSNLQCPSGYTLQGSLDSRLLDVANPADEIYYYDAVVLSPASAAELSDARASFSCAPSGGIVARYQTPIEGGCDSSYARDMAVGGSMAQRSTAGTWRQDTYNSGVNKCKHYTLAGCPAWCSRWTWANLEYRKLQCSRPAGAYLARESSGQRPNPAYSPSVIICGKS